MRDWRLLCDAGLLCALTWTALRRKNAAPGQRSSEKGWHGSAPEPTGQEYKGRREGRIQRDMHAGWVREAWPLQQVSIMCQGSPGTLKADIPDGLRQLARVLRKDSGVFTGGKCGGDRILRWHMVSQIVTDGVPYFSPYPSGGAALPDAYTRAFGPHTVCLTVTRQWFCCRVTVKPHRRRCRISCTPSQRKLSTGCRATASTTAA